MLTLIIGTILSIRAWRNGWGAGALVPPAVAYGLIMLIAAGADPESAGTVLVLAIVIEIAMLFVLGAMGSSAEEAALESPRTEVVQPSAVSHADGTLSESSVS